MLDSVFIGALNHLLQQNSSALTELKGYAGKHLRIVSPVWGMSLMPLDTGYFHEAVPNTEPDASIKLSVAQFLRLASSNFSDISSLDIDGEIDFATTLLKTFRTLRWDATEDLSKIIGDIAAERAVNTASAVWQWQKSVVNNIAQTSAEFLSEEQFLLARPGEVKQWVQDVAELRDRVARLEKRLERLL